MSLPEFRRVYAWKCTVCELGCVHEASCLLTPPQGVFKAQFLLALSFTTVLSGPAVLWSAGIPWANLCHSPCQILLCLLTLAFFFLTS